MMYVSSMHGHPLYEPANDRELAQWRPCAEMSLQFVKIARGQFWIFHDGQFLGCAQQLVGLEAWQATSNERGCCIAPLDSPLECAWSLLEYETVADFS